MLFRLLQFGYLCFGIPYLYLNLTNVAELKKQTVGNVRKLSL